MRPCPTCARPCGPKACRPALTTGDRMDVCCARCPEIERVNARARGDIDGSKYVSLARAAATFAAEGDMPGYVEALALLAGMATSEAEHIRDVLAAEVQA